MRVPSAPLEDWLRDYYFEAEIDISSSGVEPYSMADVRRLAGVSDEDIDALVLGDGYSYGHPSVREAIAGRWGDGDVGKVMTTCGSSEAIWLVLSSLVMPGDEVIVMRPGYHSLVELVAGVGGQLRHWDLTAGDGFRASVDRLVDLVTPRTKAIVVNFPHNPTGITVGAEEMRAIVAAADGAGAYLLWDAAFSDITYEAPPLPDVSTLYDRGVGFGTFSKCFGLPGLRFGWCLGPPALLADCVRLRDYSTLHVSPLIELFALRVLLHADAFIEPRLARARTNRELLENWVAAHTPAVSLVLPAGGVAAFPLLTTLAEAGTDALCERLFRSYGVLVIPGSCWGFPGHIRLGFGGETAQLSEGLDRLVAALAAG